MQIDENIKNKNNIFQYSTLLNVTSQRVKRCTVLLGISL